MPTIFGVLFDIAIRITADAAIALASYQPVFDPEETSAAAVHYPALPRTAATAELFAPPGWEVETQARGDLNSDGASDLAFVLTADDARQMGGREPEPNPRILGVAFFRPSGGYALALQNNAFLPRKRRPNGLSDGYMLFEDGSLVASRERLRITFEYTRGHRTFTFGWRQRALRLIGYDAGDATGGCAQVVSINFLTRRARMSAGWVDREDERESWRRIATRPLLTLDRIGDGEELAAHKFDRFPPSCPERT